MTRHNVTLYRHLWLLRSVAGKFCVLLTRWTWPSLVPRKITQGDSTVYRNDVAVQEVVCTWMQNSEMDICHSSILKLVQLG